MLPRLIYRQIDSKGHTEAIFTQNKLNFSKPLDFNDPFDCRPKFSFLASNEDIRKYFMESAPRILIPHSNRKQRRAEVKKNHEKSKIQKSENIRFY